MLGALAKGTNYLIGRFLRKKKIFIGSSLFYLDRERDIDKNYFDYIRLATLELVSHEIDRKKLEGSVAELGVYKGKFARYLNQYSPIVYYTSSTLLKDLITGILSGKSKIIFPQVIRIFLIPR